MAGTYMQKTDNDYSKYTINPQICSTCKYRCTSKNPLSNKCDYILIVGHMRPKEKSSFNHCEAYEKDKTASRVEEKKNKALWEYVSVS